MDNEEVYRVMLEEAAEKGANKALSRLGLGDDSAIHDIHDLRTFMVAWRGAKKTAVITTIRIIVTSITLAFIAWLLHPWSLK